MAHHTRNPIRWHGNITDGFTQLPNELVRDNRLSLAARGTAAIMRSHSDGYEVSVNGIAKESGSKWGTINRHFDELITHGWLAVTHYVTANGTRAYDEYHLHAERPFDAAEQLTMNKAVVLAPKPAELSEEPDTTNDDERQPRDESDGNSAYPAPPGRMIHRVAGEYLPHDCTDCAFYGRACGNVVEQFPSYEEYRQRESEEELCPF